MKKKVALVLGSGGARGAAHIGVIRELEKNGYEITSIAGTSMGALIGGVYASGKLDEYEAWLCSLNKMGVFNLVDFTLSHNGIIKADKVLKKIQEFIPDQKIEDLPMKYVAIATDLRHKKEVVIDKGSLYSAIRASISIPIVITPLQINDALFVDGGVLNPVPTNRIFRQKDDMLIAVDVNALIPYDEPKTNNSDWSYLERLTSGKLVGFQKKLTDPIPVHKKEHMGYFDLISETSLLMLSQIAKLTLQMSPPDMLIEISRQTCGVFDFYRASELIEIGKKETKKSLEKLESKRQLA